MGNSAPNTDDEQAILARLGVAHKAWRDARPQPANPRVDRLVELDEIVEKLRNTVRQAPDVELLALFGEDPVRALIWSLLSGVGWRLYAKGGIDLLTFVYQRIERDEHPGFASAVGLAWRDVGFPQDPGGTWSSSQLL